MNRAPAGSRRGRPPQRPLRQRPRRKAQASREEPQAPQPFRVLIAVSRPRYRSRAERATLFDDWAVRILTNKEDPIGLINQLVPDIYVVSEDFGGSKKMGMLTAAQRWRKDGLKIVALFEDEGEMEEAAALYDAALSPPWKTAQLRSILAGYFFDKRGALPSGGPPPKDEESDQ